MEDVRDSVPTFRSQKDLSAAPIAELSGLSYKSLVTLSGELESLIQAYNESLVAELALKDELEWEKELKNSFISLLLSVQVRYILQMMS